MMEVITGTLGGIVIAITSGVIGKSLSNNNKVSDAHCNERQLSCQNLLIEKIDNLGKKVDGLAKIVDGKLLGI